MEPEDLRESIKKQVKESRYRHSLGVEEVAYDLAFIYGYDATKAGIAALLHDCARDLSEEELFAKCVHYHLSVTEVERKRTVLLHAKVGAAIAQEIFGVEDEDILNAIIYHTTGRPAMSLLEKIIFTADYIEPNRKPIPGLNIVRELAYMDLDKAVTMISKNTLDYLSDTGVLIDNLTRETYDYYRKQSQSEE